jgi:hypothetical protein
MYLCPTIIVIIQLMLSIFLCSKVKNRSNFCAGIQCFDLLFAPPKPKQTYKTNNRFHLDFLPLQVQRGEVILSKIVLSNFHPKQSNKWIGDPRDSFFELSIAIQT